MSGDAVPSTWSVIGTSVRGAAHVRAELANQDAIAWEPRSGTGTEVVLAVSDGHGGSASFRSERGARLAVKAALEVAQDVLGYPTGQARSLSLVKQAMEVEVPRRIVQRWREEVQGDLSDRPITTEERARADVGTKRRPSSGGDDFIAYGATLITVIATDAFLAICQLGDGDALTVDRDGSVVRLFPENVSLGDETTSLCLPDAWSHARSYFRASFGHRPALVVASTDGFSNSFVDDAGFLDAVSRLWPTIIRRGLDDTARDLEGALHQMSALGSGDDITLGIVCRLQALKEQSLAVISGGMP